jgi:hypothetical protein
MAEQDRPARAAGKKGCLPMGQETTKSQSLNLLSVVIPAQNEA